MREKRRLALVERQHVLARIDRREAMTALAGALGEEERSRALASRSRALVEEYRARIDSAGGDGAALSDLARFAGALAGLSREAHSNCEDAALQTRTKQQVLAAAETRMQRMDERRDAARIALDTARERRAAPGSQQRGTGLVRKLLKPDEAQTTRQARPR